MEMTDAQRSADSRLYEWGRWSRSPDGWLGLPSRTLLSRCVEEGPGASHQRVHVLGWPDQIAETDAVVCRLPNIFRKVCIAQYAESGTLPQKAKRLGISRDCFNNRLGMALTKVAAEL